jgi:hypothetical protein
MLDEEKIAKLRGAKLIAGSSEVGEIEEVFAYPEQDRPALASVRTPSGNVLVPVGDAQIDGDRVTVLYDAETISGAPQARGDAITEDETHAVLDHFAINAPAMQEHSGAKGGIPDPDQKTSMDPIGGSENPGATQS